MTGGCSFHGDFVARASFWVVVDLPRFHADWVRVILGSLQLPSENDGLRLVVRYGVRFHDELYYLLLSV